MVLPTLARAANICSSTLLRLQCEISARSAYQAHQPELSGAVTGDRLQDEMPEASAGRPGRSPSAAAAGWAAGRCAVACPLPPAPRTAHPSPAGHPPLLLHGKASSSALARASVLHGLLAAFSLVQGPAQYWLKLQHCSSASKTQRTWLVLLLLRASCF